MAQPCAWKAALCDRLGDLFSQAKRARFRLLKVAFWCRTCVQRAPGSQPRQRENSGADFNNEYDVYVAENIRIERGFVGAHYRPVLSRLQALCTFRASARRPRSVFPTEDRAYVAAR